MQASRSVSRGWRVLALGAALAWTTGTVAIVRAQEPTAPSGAAQELPTTNQGPQFDEWGPGRPAPGAAPLVPPPHAAAPGAPAPGVPAPDWGGCNYNLAGTWLLSGQETTPTAFLYNGSVTVTQYGPWLQAVETQSGGQTYYYGRCMGDAVRFDVYTSGQFIGYQAGAAVPGGRWGQVRLNFSWATFVPQYSAGTEHWRRGGPFY
ncbi:MAG TPA: hypothetical protein VKZ60_02020 [Chloroflexota bacterium]|nr:hypothetical protein [Chloroflexota bacterium]